MIITLIKLGDSPRQAFLRGLWKGAASPLMLYAANRAAAEPVEMAPIPKVEPVRLPKSLTTMTDLQRIAGDFAAVVRRYEQEAAGDTSVISQAD